MANTLFDYARQRFLEAQINWMTDTVKVILVDTGAYTPQTAVHQYLSDISASARIAGPVTLTAKATTGGAAKKGPTMARHSVNSGPRNSADLTSVPCGGTACALTRERASASRFRVIVQPSLVLVSVRL